MCADGITADGHSFQNAVRIAFQNGTVHKCTWVTFVGIYYYIFFFRLIACCEFPFLPGRETCTTAAANAGFFYFGDDFSRCHGGQCSAQALVCVVGNCFVDIFRIDGTAVAQCNTLLLLEERDMAHVRSFSVFSRNIVQQTFYQLTTF